MSEKKSDTSARRLVVISMDGLSKREWEAIRVLPHFSSLIARGFVSRSLRTVYPSLTYVVHTSMMTGRYPDAHGVTHNHPLQPGIPEKSQRWYWYATDVKVPTLFDLARDAGMNCAAALWPLVSGARIRWNFPEISALPGENQLFKSLQAGSPAYLLDLQLRFGTYRKGKHQPELDEFVSRCAAYTIVKHKPRLLMTHLISLDDAKHRSGSVSSLVSSALVALDEALGRIVSAIEEAGLREETDLIVFGDHGHIDIHTRIRPNALLAQAGLCGIKDGEFHWRAWFRCSGGSAFLHIRPADHEALSTAVAIMGTVPGVLILGKEELAQFRTNSEAAFAVEATPGVEFVEDWHGVPRESGNFGAHHGYSPDKADYMTMFMAAGPRIQAGTMDGGPNIVDIAPTCAKLLGLCFKQSDGRIIEEMLLH